MDVDAKHLVSFFAVCCADDSLPGYPGYGEIDDVSPLERPYVPQVLCHFPKERRGLPFSDIETATFLLALPNGARFYPANTAPTRPSFHPIVITDELGNRTYGVSLRFYQRVEDEQLLDKLAGLQDAFVAANPDYAGKLSWKRNEVLLQTKALVLIMDGQYITFGRQVLEQLLACGQAEDGHHLASQHLHCLLNSVFVPKPGYMVEYPGPFHRLYCRMAPEKDLPAVDLPFTFLLKTFSVTDVLLLLKCLLLESKFILVSNDLERIVTTAELLCLLMFPFSWYPGVYAPIVPAAKDDIYDAPLPFIMGVKIDCTSPAREDFPFYLNDEVCIVNIDFGHVDIQVHKRVPLPKSSLLMANLMEKLESHAVVSPELPRDSPQHRPDTTGGLSSVCENGDLFQRGMKVCCDPDKPTPKVKVHNRHVLRRHPSPSSTMLAAGNISSPSMTAASSAASSPSNAKARLACIAAEAGISTSFTDPPTPFTDPPTPGGGSCGADVQVNGVDDDECSTPVSRDPYIQRLQAKWSEEEEAFTDQRRFNKDIQNVFLNYFVVLLHDYSLYICASTSDLVMFDKVSFLSDQPDYLLPFFDIFLETSVFNKLIESKVSAEIPPSVQYFDACLQKASTPGDVETEVEERVRRRGGTSHTLKFEQEFQVGHPFVRPQAAEFGADMRNNAATPTNGLASSDRIPTSPCQMRIRAHSTTPDLEFPTSTSPLSPDAGGFMRGLLPLRPMDLHGNAATSQATVVRRLLRDFRVKVKRLLVSYLGREALALGHPGVPIEDNVLVTNLCNAIEGVWRHGNVQRRRTSFLWSHLEAYYEERKGLLEDVCAPSEDDLLASPRHKASQLDSHAAGESNTLLSSPEASPRNSPVVSPASTSERSGGMSRSSSTPSIADLAVSVKTFTSNMRRERWSLGKIQDGQIMDLKVNAHVRLLRARYTNAPEMRRAVGLLDDIRTVKEMSAIKTDVGFARAFIRLSLEKKCLSSHVQKLLDDTRMLENAYRDYAFLRSEEEFEQSSCHLLSLTTVDMFCFSMRYSQTVFTYSILLLPGVGTRQHTATGTCQLFGGQGFSETIRLPEHFGSVSTEVTNLGIIEGMVIRCPGVSITARYSRIFVICSVTDACYELLLDPWPRSEDNINELLLVAKKVSSNVVLEANMGSGRANSVTGSSPAIATTECDDLRENVSNCVCAFAKYKDKALPQSESVLRLIWGPDCLCFHLTELFTHGLKVSRVLRSRRPAWDYIEKVCRTDTGIPEDLMAAFDLLERRTGTCKSVKFYMFVCCGMKHKSLPEWLSFLFKSNLRQKMYQPWAFLCNTERTRHIWSLTDWLRDFEIEVPAPVESFLK